MTTHVIPSTENDPFLIIHQQETSNHILQTLDEQGWGTPRPPRPVRTPGMSWARWVWIRAMYVLGTI